MAIVQCSVCGNKFNDVLPVCPYCQSGYNKSDIIDSHKSLLDGTGGKQFRIIYSGRVILFQKDGYIYGIASSFKDIVTNNYSSYNFISKMECGFFRVMYKSDCGEKWGIIDENGIVILPIEYDKVRKIKESSNVVVRVEKGGKYYLVDLTQTIKTGTLTIVMQGYLTEYRRDVHNITYDKELIDELFSKN